MFCYFFPFGVERLSSKAGKIPLLYQPKIYFFNYQILYNFCCCKALVIQNCSKKYLWFIWKLSLHWKVKLKFSSLHAPHVLMKLMILMRRITKPPTTDRPLTTNPPTGAPPTHRLPTHRQVFHRPTDNQPPTHRPPTHRPYYNWPATLWLANLILTTNPIYSTTNFNYWLEFHYYWFGKTIHKMIDKKERW